MSRLAVVFLCVVLVLTTTLVAAPAPFPRTSSQVRPWLTGWDKPVDPLGGSRFGRTGKTLTITVPGKRYNLDDGMNAPRLLRGVKGDFVVRVRVGGDFRSAQPKKNGLDRGAGLFVTDGERFVCLERLTGIVTPSLGYGIGEVNGGGISSGRMGMSFEVGPPLTRPAFLELSRRGTKWHAATSVDGKVWTETRNECNLELNSELKVGVVAEVASDGNFTASFDHFELTELSR